MLVAVMAAGCAPDNPDHCAAPTVQSVTEESELPCPGCYGAPCFTYGDCKKENICVKRGPLDGVCCQLYQGGAICPP